MFRGSSKYIRLLQLLHIVVGRINIPELYGRILLRTKEFKKKKKKFNLRALRKH